MANILILGGGFGGLVAARKLAAALDPSHTVTLVAPTRSFIFYPSLVRVAFGELSPEDISFDLPAALREIGVRFVQGEAIRIHPVSKRVEVTGDDINGTIAYDHLVVAMGRRLALGQVKGLIDNSHHLLGTKAALKFGEAVNSFHKGHIVVGSTPGASLPIAVCETAFALAKRFAAEVEAGTVSVSVIFPGSLEEAFCGADLHKELEAAFAKRKIGVHCNVPISEVTPTEIVSTAKHRIPHDLLMLVPPFRGNTNLRDIGFTDGDDFLKVDNAMRIQGAIDAYAVGDIVDLEGPKLAHLAVKQAEVAAANIISAIKHSPVVETYEHEITDFIDSGGAESIFLRYGVNEDPAYGTVRQGRFWTWAKAAHDAYRRQ